MKNWFRRKEDRPGAGAVFPARYVDLHSHILPGLDDGAASLEDSLSLLDEMVGLGIRRFVCTPHVMEGVWNNTSDQIRFSLEAFGKVVDERYAGEVRITAAAEYMIDGGIMNLIRERDLLPLSGNLVLVEMSYIAPPLHLYSALAELQVAGYRPVLAHPERYFFYHDDWEAYLQLKEAGCLFQMNLLSLSHYYGKSVRKVAEKLMKEGLYDMVGSDLHHARHMAHLKELTGKRGFWKLAGELIRKNEEWLRV